MTAVLQTSVVLPAPIASASPAAAVFVQQAAAMAGRTKSECAPLTPVTIPACTVSFTTVSGVRHGVDLEAKSVYEAAFRGIALPKKDGWVYHIGSGTQLACKCESRRRRIASRCHSCASGVTASR